MVGVFTSKVASENEVVRGDHGAPVEGSHPSGVRSKRCDGGAAMQAGPTRECQAGAAMKAVPPRRHIQRTFRIAFHGEGRNFPGWSILRRRFIRRFTRIQT
jgi:hypothetical protein